MFSDFLVPSLLCRSFYRSSVFLCFLPSATFSLGRLLLLLLLLLLVFNGRKRDCLAHKRQRTARRCCLASESHYLYYKTKKRVRSEDLRSDSVVWKFAAPPLFNPSETGSQMSLWTYVKHLSAITRVRSRHLTAEAA